MRDLSRRALVIDDDDAIRWVLEKALTRCDLIPETVSRASLARAALARERYALVFIDVRLPDGDGLTLLKESRAGQPDARAVVITAQDAMSTAIEAMKLGAYDFLPKPFDIAQVSALAEEILRRSNEPAPMLGPADDSASGLVGRSHKMLEVVKSIGRVAPTNATVLITGESGTGKELVARAIHANSLRAGKPFVTVNTAAIPRTLLESELYGHERGSFTGAADRHIGKFEQASSGTLFLDEIGDMPQDQQAKLLRALQERVIERVGGAGVVPVDVRVIAASNVDLTRAVEQRTFREDLFYRLNVVPIHLPPLREHPADIPVLVAHFLAKHQADCPGRRVQFTEEALEILLNYPWPGNVRELENTVRRAVVLARTEEIRREDLLEILPALSAGTLTAPSRPLEEALEEALDTWIGHTETTGELYRRFMDRLEGLLFSRVLARTRGNQLRAAQLLGINRNTLAKKITILGLRKRPIRALDTQA